VGKTPLSRERIKDSIARIPLLSKKEVILMSEAAIRVVVAVIVVLIELWLALEKQP
jgi:hypothetical protein